MTIFEAAEKLPGPEGSRTAPGYYPATTSGARRTSTKIRPPAALSKVPANSADRRNCRNTACGFFIWRRNFATTAPIPACAWRHVRGRRFTKRPEDGIVLIDQSRCRGYRKCVEGCPYKKAIYRPTTHTSEKCNGCFPRIEGKDAALSPTGARAETRCMAACVGKIRLQGLVKTGSDGTWEADPKNPLYYLSASDRWRCRCIRNSARNPTAFIFRPGGCRAVTWCKCSARASIMPSNNTVAPIANCWPCCNCFEPIARSYFGSKWKKVRRWRKSKSRCQTANRKRRKSSTIRSSAITNSGKKWCELRWKNPRSNARRRPMSIPSELGSRAQQQIGEES